MPGFKNWKLYPTGKPNRRRPSRSRSVQHRLLRQHEPDLDRDPAAGQERPSKIGINANLKTFPFAVRIAKEGHRGEPFDLDLQAWGADYPDPVDHRHPPDGRNIQAENNNNNASSTTRDSTTGCGQVASRTSRSATPRGSDRPRRDEEQAPLAPLFFRTVSEFTSKRIGCWSYQPIYGAMNLNAVCIG
jgi:hypothetical protein